MAILLILAVAFLGFSIWLYLRFRDLRSTALRTGFELPLRIEAFSGYGRSDSFYVLGRVSKDGGRLSSLNAEFDLMGFMTRVRRNLRRFLLPEMEGVPVQVNIAGVERETMTDAHGRIRLHFKEQPILKPGLTIFSIRLHPGESRFDARKAVGEIFVPNEGCSLGVVSDVDDTILESHIRSKIRLFIHNLFSSVSDLQPTPGFPSLLSALVGGKSGKDSNPVYYVSGSPANLHDKLQAFLRAKRFPLGPLFLTSIGRTPEASFFQQRIFKTEQIRHLFDLFPSIRFVFIGDNGQFDSEIYQQIAREYPGRVAATLIYERVSPLKSQKIIPLGQHRVSNALDAGIVLYRRGLISYEGLEGVANELMMARLLPSSFKLERKLKQLDRRQRAARRRSDFFASDRGTKN